MSPDKSPQNLFNEALERPDATERARFLDEACGADAALRERVEKLLRAHDEAGGFFSQPSKASSSALVSSATALPVTEKPGDKIGRYKLLQQIGEGGCGVVYMAEQEEPVRRRVALKVIKLGMETKQVIARFEAERQALALMDHPNIARVLDAGATETGRPYFVMELVRGIKITEFCDENKLSTEDRLKLFMLVCKAIQHAHQKGVIHRDIKPSNILITINDGVPVPKVIDFGIAKATAGRLTDRTLFTAFEQFIGTPAYMSPEQAVMTSLDIDTRSDIYSLGVLLYELLTGSPPFDQRELLAAGLDEMRRIIREAEVPRPSTRLSTMAADALTTTAQHQHTEPPKLIHQVRGDLDWIVMKCLEKDRARRYETANGLAMDIERHLNCEPVTARPPSRLYEFQKTVRRHKLGFAAAGAVTTTLIIGLGVSTWQFVQKNHAYHRASTAELEQTRLRQIAETKEKQSEQVAQFLKDMLNGVGPSVALGRDTTMLREILDKTAERINKRLTNQPQVEIELRTTLADVYYEIGLYQQAEQIAVENLRLCRSHYGTDNPAVAKALQQQGRASRILRKGQQAEKIHLEALTLMRKIYGDEHPDIAASLYDLALALEEQERLAEAETAIREALAIRKKLLGSDCVEVAVALKSLAYILREEGELPEAESVAREALAIQTRLFGKEHPYVADVLGELSYILLDQGKLTEAEVMRREVLTMRRRFLGNEHPQIAYALLRLSEMLEREGRLAEAESHTREALAIYSKLQNPDVITALNHLARLLGRQGRYAEAQIVIREGAKRDDAYSLNSLARLLATCDDPTLRDGDEAVTFAEKAVAATDRNNARMLDTLAAAYAEAGQFAKAVSTQKEAIALEPNPSNNKRFASRLKLYESNTPYHERQ